MAFNDFVHKYNLKNKATSNSKLYEVLRNKGLDSKVGIYLRDEPFSSDTVIVNLNPSKGTHWVCYLNEKYFDSYGCVCPKKLPKFIIKRNGYCLYSEYQTRKKNDRKFLCELLFVYTLFDKSVRNGFYICCFVIVLSKILLILNGIGKNNR